MKMSGNLLHHINAILLVQGILYSLQSFSYGDAWCQDDDGAQTYHEVCYYNYINNTYVHVWNTANTTQSYNGRSNNCERDDADGNPLNGQWSVDNYCTQNDLGKAIFK